MTRKEFLTVLATKGIEMRPWHLEHLIASGKLAPPALNASGWRTFTTEHVQAVVMLETQAAAK